MLPCINWDNEDLPSKLSKASREREPVRKSVKDNTSLIKEEMNVAIEREQTTVTKDSVTTTTQPSDSATTIVREETTKQTVQLSIIAGSVIRRYCEDYLTTLV